jgi:aspartyl-tRNA(Asn)/glutamyl-tRNA(Gln) amidotransferase subunit A
VHRRWFDDDSSRYGTEIRRRLETIMGASADDVVRAIHWRRRLQRAADEAFSGVDVLLTPATAARLKVIGEDTVDGGEGPESYRRALSWFVSLVNQIGCPALTAPIAFEGSPPPSLQLIAPWWEEARLLEMGLALEAAGVIGPVTPGQMR